MVGPVCVGLWVILGEERVLFVLGGGGVWQSAGDIRGGAGIITQYALPGDLCHGRQTGA